MITLESQSYCTMTCVGDGTKNCGGTFGSIAVYAMFPASSLKGLTLLVHDGTKQDMAGQSPAKDAMTGDAVYVDLVVGAFECTTASPKCELDGNMPPVEITIDYGDGSGYAEWTRENTQVKIKRI